jgi:beta-lactamase regulating signal transducer with metallopeptidase domain
MMSVGPDYWVYLLAWVVLHFTWQGAFLVISWRACEPLLRAATPQVRYRTAWLHLAALGAAPLLTLLVSHRALLKSMSAGRWAAAPRWAQSLSPSPSLLWPLFHFLGRALPGLLALWTVGVLIGGGFLLAGWARHWCIAPVHSAPSEVLALVYEIAGKLELHKCPRVLQARVASPFVHGARRQRLVLPYEIEWQLPPPELKAVLAHELVHLKRSDYASNLVQTMLVILAWPHPAAWYLWARARREREACCDDLAVQICGSAAPLARALYRLAARTPVFDGGALAAATGLLERRLRRLLEPRQASAALASRAVALPALGALALATLLFACQLPADLAAQRAFIASRWSPTVTIHAHDPAGSFQVKIRQGQVLAISLGDERVPLAQVIQQGDVVRVLGHSGQELLCLTVMAGGGIRWEARPRGKPSAL